MKTRINPSTLAALACCLLISCIWFPAHAQNNVVTYLGRVQSGGVPFTGEGQFKFALVTSSNTAVAATATATVSGGFVTIITVNNGGIGYVTPPPVTITGGSGSGAVATASISGGVVTAITVNNQGSGYAGTPTVTIAPPPETLAYVTYWSHDGTSSAGSEPASAVTMTVTGGLFNARLGDPARMSALPAGLFIRPDLRLRLWFDDGVNGFGVLNPAQPLTAAPYAFFAGSASNLLGTLSSANLGGTYSGPVTLNNPANSYGGSGAGLTALNASQLTSGTVADARLSANVSLLGAAIESAEIADGTIGAGDVNAASFNTTFWRVTGNAGTSAGTHFLGTTDNQPLELKVNGLRILRLENTGDSADFGTTPDGAPNVIGGSPLNYVTAGVVGAVIGGGGATNYSGVAYTNSVLSDFGFVGGGGANRIATFAVASTIGGAG
jgi:hypothetical protein